MLEIKNTVTEVKNDIDGISSRLDLPKGRKFSELEEMTTGTSKTKMQQEKETVKEQNMQELWDN